MSDFIHNPEEDVMDLLSVSDNLEMTREEESTLLEEDSMAVDSPVKSSANQSDLRNSRKPIVYDLDYSRVEDDNNDKESDSEMREKFKSERKTISYSLNEPKKRDIPDSLVGLGREILADYRQKRIDTNQLPRRQRKTRNRGNRFRKNSNDYSNGRPQLSSPYSRPGANQGDLRQLINNCNQQSNQLINRQHNPFLAQGLGMTPLMNYQLGLGILNPATVQNQLLVNALLAQSVANPLINRLSIGGQTPFVANNSAKKPKDDIQITVFNENKVSTGFTNKAKTLTKPQIRCRVADVDTTDSTDSEAIKNVPSMAPNAQKKGLNTMFSKHLAAKVKQTIAPEQSTSVASGGLFGDALAEVEVGVDNDYLRRMQEQEKKRLEIQKQKEMRRLEMADERLESALKMKQKIQRSY